MQQQSFSSEEIYNILKEEILSLQIKPGDALGENMLCSRFGTSRTPVRAVLRRLEGLGLVQIIPHKGTFVTRLDLDEINQLIYLRVAVESSVLSDFMDVVTPMMLEKIRYIIRKQRVVLESGEPLQAFLTMDTHLHGVWFKETGKTRLWDIIQKHQVHYTRFRMLDITKLQHIENIIEDHERLLDIIENKDKDAVLSYLDNHLFGAIKRVSDKVTSTYRDYFIEEKPETSNFIDF